MTRRPRLTVRARLTLIYTGLFAVCGAIVVAVSYILVARLEPQGQSQQAPASFLARCRSEQLSAHPDDRILAKCSDSINSATAEIETALFIPCSLAKIHLTMKTPDDLFSPHDSRSPGGYR